MAKKDTPEKVKAEKPWKTVTIATSKNGATEWRAQISTAPDGKEFAGLRKYVIKKDGTEIADRAGFSVLNDEHAGGILSNIVGILNSMLLSSAIKWKAGKHPAAKAAKATKKAEEKATKPKKLKKGEVAEDDPIYCLMNVSDQYYVSHRVTGEGIRIKKSDDEEDALQFESEDAAEKQLKRMKKDGVKSSWTTKRWN